MIIMILTLSILFDINTIQVLGERKAPKGQAILDYGIL